MRRTSGWTVRVSGPSTMFDSMALVCRRSGWAGLTDFDDQGGWSGNSRIPDGVANPEVIELLYLVG